MESIGRKEREELWIKKSSNRATNDNAIFTYHCRFKAVIWYGICLLRLTTNLLHNSWISHFISFPVACVGIFLPFFNLLVFEDRKDHVTYVFSPLFICSVQPKRVLTPRSSHSPPVATPFIWAWTQRLPQGSIAGILVTAVANWGGEQRAIIDVKEALSHFAAPRRKNEALAR